LCPLPLARAKNGDKQKFHAANQKAQHALRMGPVFGNEFFVFLPMCTQCVPMWFTWGSPSSHIVPHYFPNSTSDLSPMVCPKLNSYVYKLKPWAIWEHICFYFANKGSKRCFYWWVPNVPKKKLMMGPNNYGSFETPQKKKSCEWHPWTIINTNHTTTLSHKFDLLVSKEMANKEMEAVKSP
jgi:hypothetical protein